MSRNSSVTPVLVIIAAAAATSVTGCSDDTEDVYFTCVNEEGVVVDPNYCDNYDGGGYYFFSSNTHYGPGTHAPSGWHNTRFRPNDVAARQRMGIPPTGKVPTKVTVGGFGKGSTFGNGGS